MKKSKATGLIVFLVIAGAAALAVGATSAWFTNWTNYKQIGDWFANLSPSTSQSSSSADGTAGIQSAYKTLSPRELLNEDAHTDITITGTVNATATYKKLAWSKSWADSAVTANLSDYVEISSTSDTSTGGTCVIHALKAFTSYGDVRITATTFDGATAYLDFNCYNPVTYIQSPVYWDDAAISAAAERFNAHPVTCETFEGTTKAVQEGHFISGNNYDYEINKCFAVDWVVGVEDNLAAPSYFAPVYETGITNHNFVDFSENNGIFTSKQRGAGAAVISALGYTVQTTQKLVIDYVGIYRYNDYMGSTANETADEWVIDTVWHFVDRFETGTTQTMTIDGEVSTNVVNINGYVTASSVTTSASSGQM